MIGRRLSQEEAKRLLAKLEWGQRHHQVDGATVELIPAQVLERQNPQCQTVTRPTGRHFQWLSLEKSLGSKPE